MIQASGLQPALLELARAREELGLEVEPTRATTPLAAVVGSGELDDWLRLTASIAEGVDAKTAAAYLISIFVWRFDEVVASLYLSGTTLPHLTADDVRVGMFVEEYGDSRDIQFRFHFADVDGGARFDPQTLRRSFLDLHEPLVVALHRRTGLSQSALWRLVSDGISGGFLAYGKRAHCIEKAMQAAQDVLSAPPFRNAQWSFLEAAAGTRSEWFRLRGGCCRLYLTVGGEYCTTCVLRRREDQVERLERFLARSIS